MNKRTVALFFLAVAIVFASRQLTSFQLFPILGPVESSSGDLYTAVELQNSRSLVFRESAATGDTRIVSESWTRIEAITFSEPFNKVILADQFLIQSLSPFSKNQSNWKQRHLFLSVFRVMPIPDVNCLLVVGRNLDQPSFVGRECVRIFDLADGRLKHEFFGPEIRRVVVGRRAVYCESEDDAELLTWTGDNRDIKITNHPPGCQASILTGKSASIVWHTEQSPQKDRKKPHWLASSSGCTMAAMTIAVAMLVWFCLMMLSSPDISSSAPLSPWIAFQCLVTLLAMLYLIGVPLGTPLFQASSGPIRESLPRNLLLGLGQAIGFLLLMKIDQKRQVWMAILATCTIPMLLPVMILVLFLRRDELKAYVGSNTGGLFRFGIGEMLLATMGIAIFMQFGILSIQLLALSVPFMIHILISYLLARNIEVTWGVAITSLAVLTWILAAQISLNDLQFMLEKIVYLLIVPLSFSVLGILRQFEEPVDLQSNTSSHKKGVISAVLFLLLQAGFAPAALGQTPASGQGDTALNWPQWRGPNSTGAVENASPPIEWSETSNIHWKAKLPGRGHSTPIVWENHVFVTTAIPVGEKLPPRLSGRPGEHDNLPVDSAHQFVVIALDRRNGSIQWQRTVHETVPIEGAHYTASLASASPVTDGHCVYAFFGSYGLYCLDFDGNLKWSKQLGTMHTKHGHGEGSSPTLFQDSLIVNWDHEGESFLVALDTSNGKEQWRRKRNEVTSWSSPIVVQRKGVPQVIVCGTERVRGYDLRTGETLWECGGMSANIVATPVADRATVFVGSSYEKRALMAINIDGASGDITDSERVLWRRSRGTPYVPSPLLYDDGLYFLAHYQNVMTRVDAKTGTESPGAMRLGPLGNIYASPVAAGGHVYVTDLDGVTIVISGGPIPKMISVNQINEPVSASAAIAGNALFLRGDQHLYCISDQ